MGMTEEMMQELGGVSPAAAGVPMGGDPAAIMQPQPQQPLQGVEPIHVQALLLAHMAQMLQVQDTKIKDAAGLPQWELQIFAQYINTLAQAFDALEMEQTQSMSPEQQFALESAKMQQQMQLDQQRLQMDLEKHQLTLQIEQMKAQMDLQIKREQADAKAQQAQVDMQLKAAGAAQDAELKERSAATQQAQAAHAASLAERELSSKTAIAEKAADQEPKGE